MDTEEVDYIGFAKKLWLERRLTVIWVTMFFALGLFIALISPKEYTVVTKMIPSIDQSSSLGSGIGGLASLAGINLNGTSQSSDIPPSIYPEILNSTPFMQKLLMVDLHSEKFQNPIGYMEYQQMVISKSSFSQLKKFTIGLPNLVLSSIRGNSESGGSSIVRSDSLIRISGKEIGAINSLSTKIQLSVDRRSGVITLTMRMPEPTLAAEMAYGAQNLLLKTITDFRILKAKEYLNFTQRLVDEKRAEFKKAQAALSEYRDENLNVSTSKGQNEEELLKNQYDLTYNVLIELSQQLESAKIKVEKDTPAFSVIQPVVVPLERSKPQRLKIVIGTMAVGFFLGLGHILLKMLLSSLREKW